jgi:hypothetical protein
MSALSAAGRTAIYEELLRVKETGGLQAVSEVFA